MRSMILISAAIGLLGCTVDEGVTSPPDTTSNAANASSNSETSPGANNLSTSEEVTISVVPREWGLFAADVDAAPRVLFDGMLEETTTVTVPAGVFELSVAVSGTTRYAAASKPMSGLSGTFALTEESPTRFFSADAAEVRVAWNDDEVTIARVDSAPAPARPDALGHSGDAGHAFDAFFDTYDPSGEDREPVFTLLAALHELGGAPVPTDAGDLFVAPILPGDAPQVRGTFNDWSATPEAELRQLVPGLAARVIATPLGRHAYKFVYGESWVTDTSNRHIEWDGIDTGTIGNFNSVLRPDAGASRLVFWPRVYSPQLDNYRDVYVYLPAGYGAEVHPLLISHDGNESIVRGQFHEVIDTWSASAEVASRPVVAFVALPSQDVRLDEYMFATEGARGPDYADFLAQTLLPRLREGFDLDPDRRATGLVGASLGGLISYVALTRHSERFGYAAGMSSSFFVGADAMLDRIAANGCYDADFYLDSGSPNDNYEVTRQLRDLLEQQGCRYRYRLDEGGTHEWWKWNERLPGVLDHFAQVSR